VIISGQTTLSETKSKSLLQKFGVVFAAEIEVTTDGDQIANAVKAAEQIGFPVVVKLCGDSIAHKTERGLVRLGVNSADATAIAARELLAKATVDDGDVSLLIAKMESGKREFIAGVMRDPQFGLFVMLGLGGIYAEVIADVAFAPVPLSKTGALALQGRLRQQKILESFRGESAVSKDQLADALVALSNAAESDQSISSIDINPILIRNDGSIVAVDALVVKDSLKPSKESQSSNTTGRFFESLFNPRGVVVVGASTHPGKFGFVSLHNLISCGYKGQIFATHLELAEVLGVQSVATIDDLPENEIDLAFVCTPASTNISILEACARKNIRSVYITSAGYGEAGESGVQAQKFLKDKARELDILLIGPNGQGLVSTPVNLCAQIVGPYPPKGAISVASQSGNFVSSFMNYARFTNVGIARAISAGNAACTGVPEVLDFFATDAATSVALVYLEGIQDGEKLASSMKSISAVKPLVIVKGGSTSSGALAAASHTGALASNDRVFDGVCFSNGVTRVASAEEAFDIAATFATQPLPKGPNVVVLTTVGGWGVVTSDVISNDNVLNLISLPQDLSDAISALLPDRWSHNNPVDCAGGETRDTIPEVMRLIATHPSVDSIIFLGLGIQSNQARLMTEGHFYPDFGLERIVSYHQRQDERFAQIAAELSIETEKPILVATELGVADTNNSGVKAVQESGRLCYANGQRAAKALALSYQYSKWRGVAK
jgi:acyl-CoA synthetase (NDP forming)